jgi:TPR repeat protein
MKHLFKSFALVITLLFSGSAVVYAQDIRSAGAAYDSGDYSTAFREFSILAAKGDAIAQSYLGLMYGLGEGVAKDDKEAVKWYRLSAEQGFGLAQFSLGYAYQVGRGVAQDYREAIKWYRLSAEQGNAMAQNNLGQMYGLGQGVTQDYVYAHLWFNIAVSNGIERAVTIRDSLAQQMTKEQLAEAQRLARECQRKNYKGC